MRLRLGCVLRVLLWGRMVVVVMVLLLLGRHRLVLRWKRFNLLRVVLGVRVVDGLLFLVLVWFDFDGGSVGDGRDDGGAADGHFRGGGMVRKVRGRRDVLHRGAVVGDFVGRRLLLGVVLLGRSAAVVVRDLHLHLGRVAVGNVSVGDVRRRMV